MKKLLVLALSLTFFLNVNAQIKTPQPSPFSKIEQKVGLTDVTLEFSRPSMRGRTIFGDLVPFGKLWRLGANANTKITFSDDVTVSGQTLKAGTYAIYATPNTDTWDVVFYNDATNWGTPKTWDASKVAAKITVKTFKIPMKIETLTMTFDDLNNNGASLGILWEDTFVNIPFEVPTDKTVTSAISKAMNGPAASDYYNAAVYYLQSGKDINQAKTWIDKAMTLAGDKAPFYQLRKQSLIYAKAGDIKGAIKIAKKSLSGAEKAGNADYVKMNTDSIKAWANK